MSPLELLIQLLARDSTGQLYVATEHGRPIRIGIDVGRIVHIACGPRRGRAALDQAVTEVARSAAFQPGAATSWDGDLPSDRALLGQLWPMLGGVRNERPVRVACAANGEDFDSLEEVVSTGPPPHWPAGTSSHVGTRDPKGTPASPDFATPAHLRSTLTASQIASVKALLLEFVGPMAQYLVDECLIVGAHDVSALVDAVAQEIDSYRDARAFLVAAGHLGYRS